MAKKGKEKTRKGRTVSLYRLLLGGTIVLLFFGTVMIFSASQIVAYAQTKDSYFYLKRHLFAMSLGLAGLYLFSKLDYRIFRKLSLLLVFSSIGLLVLVLIPGIGKTAGGSSRWLDLGFFNFQPSELAKFSMVVYAVSLFTQRKKDRAQLKEVIFPLFPLLGLVFLLVIFQPDLGTALVLGFTVLTVVFIAGAKKSYVFGLGFLGFLTTIFLIFAEPYRFRRLLAFLNPWDDPQGKGFHIIQSLLALGSGGLQGVGLGMSRQKFFYLPAGHTDFILAIVGEELGLGGTLFLVLMFLFLTYIGIRIAYQAKDRLGRILGGGIITLILFQAIINMGVVIGLLPITGIPLPLISFGGSSLVFTLLEIGILLNIASQEREFGQKVYNARDNLRRRNRRTHLPRNSSGRRIALQGRR